MDKRPVAVGHTVDRARDPRGGGKNERTLLPLERKYSLQGDQIGPLCPEYRAEWMRQSDLYRMIRRRAAGAGRANEIGCHTFRATGITTYLKNGGKLEVAQEEMAAREPARTTGLY